MKIVNRDTFLSMPPNTVYANYKPCFFGEICIKGETLNNDFSFQSLLNIKSESSEEFISILEDARANGNSFQLDLDCEGRDGLFDKDQLFAIFEKQDVIMLIDRLSECLIEDKISHKKYTAEDLIKQYLRRLPKNYGQMILETPSAKETIAELIAEVHSNAYLLGRYEGKQAYHLMQFKDELEIVMNDLGVVIMERIGSGGADLLKKYDEVTRLIKEIREELKGEKK